MSFKEKASTFETDCIARSWTFFISYYISTFIWRFIDAFYTQILNKDRRYFFRKWRIPERCHIKVSARKPLQKALFLRNVLDSFLKENSFFFAPEFLKRYIIVICITKNKDFFGETRVGILYKKVFYSITLSEAFPSRR